MIIDVIFLMAAGYGFYIGFSRGIIQTVFTAFAYLFGILAAFKFAPVLSTALESILNNHTPLVYLAGFLLAFIIVVLVIRFLGAALEGALQIAHINFINQFAGGALMAAVIVLFYSILLWFTDNAHLLSNEVKEDSRSYVVLKDYPEAAKNLGTKVAPVLQEVWGESLKLMNRLQENTESDARIRDLKEKAGGR